MTIKSKTGRPEDKVGGETRAQYVARLKRHGMTEARATRMFTDKLYDQSVEAPKRAAARGAIDQAARAAAAAQARITVGDEPTTYHRGGEHNFLRDALNEYLSRSVGGTRDPRVGERLQRHQSEHRRIASQIQERAASGTTAFAGLVVPQFLTDLAAPLARPGRPLANICRKHVLPAEGMSVTLSRITTGTSANLQSTEGSPFSSTAIDDTALVVPVVTVGGFNDISIQAAMRGVGVEDVTVEDLIRGYHSELDRMILTAGDGTNGTPISLQATAGINAVSYVDATPTVAELWLKLADAKQRIQGGVFAKPTHIVMAPRRLGWFEGAVDSTGRPLVAPIGGGVDAVNATAPADGPASVGNTGYAIARLPVVDDGNVPLTLGAGTEDEIFVVNANELHLWEDPSMPLGLRFEQPVGHQGQVRIVVFGFAAFTAGRYPAATSLITGSGLIANTF